MRPSLAAVLFAAALVGCADDPNTSPTSLDDQSSTSEDQAVVVDVLANDADPDNDALHVASAVADVGDVAIVADGIRVTPPADFHGEIHVEVEVSDGDATAASKTVVVVEPVNDAPTAAGATAVTGRNAVVAITLAGADVDGDPLVYEIAGQPAHGELAGDAPDLIYVPAADFIGDDELTFVARDPSGATSAPATVAISVLAGAMPVATAQPVSTAEDTARGVVLAATDGDGDALVYAVTTPPAHGTLSGTAPDLIYTPDDDFHGDDAFAFTATDGVLTSVPAQVSITVTPVNDAPVAVAASASTQEDAAASFTLAGTDVDGDPLVYAIAAAPANGAVTLTGATAVYTPTADRNGPDSFTFTVSDGVATSAPAQIAVAVAAVPDAPVASAQSASGVEDAPIAITLAASDADGQALTYTFTSGPSHGTLVGAGPVVIYQPAANYHGPDAITFVASDGGSTSAPATISIDVASVNDAPVVESTTVVSGEDFYKDITLAATDVDGDPLVYTIVAAPTHGALTGNGATRQYRPVQDYNGPDSLTWQVTDGQRTVSATISLVITPRNDMPRARDDVAMTAPGVAVVIDVLANDEDVDGDALHIWDSAQDWPHGVMSWDDGQLVYTPDAGFTGTEYILYWVEDPAGSVGDIAAWVRIGVGQFPAGVNQHVASAVTSEGAGLGTQHSLSVDGRYLAFLSDDALVAGDTNGAVDAYVMDRLDRGLELVSLSSAGVLGDGATDAVTVSGDGRLVAFASAATNLVDGDTNGVADVFVHDRETGVTTRVSVGPGGAQSTGASGNPEISTAGTVIAFTSTAADLVADDTNGVADVFVRDLAAQTTTRVSVTNAGGQADGLSDEATLALDGNVVAFRSAATNLVAGDTNGRFDVFLRDLVAGTTVRVSVSVNGNQANNHSGRPALSADGRVVAFASQATNLVPDATPAAWKGYLHDLDNHPLYKIPMTYGNFATGRIRMSGDGRYLAVHSVSGEPFVYDRVESESQQPGAGNYRPGYFPVLSRNGAYVAIVGGAPASWESSTIGTDVYVLSTPH